MNATPEKFIIARRLNSHNDLDYLHAWDAKHGTDCGMNSAKAMRFATAAEADAAREKCRALVPVWFGSKSPIEYLILPVPA